MNATSNSKKGFIPFLILLLLAVITAVLILAPFFQNAAPDAAGKTAQSVITLNLYDANGVLLETGSGYAAFDKDIIITNHHCLKGGVSSIEAQRMDGSTFSIDSVVAYDEKADIAILRAPNCGLTPLKLKAKENLEHSVSIESAQALYDSRTAEQEISLADWYAQSDHSYTVDYILVSAGKLHNQAITTSGYISGIDTDLYLVSDLDLVAYLDARDSYDFDTSMKLQDLKSDGYTLQVDTDKNHLSTDNLKLGDLITVEGTVVYYSASDIRLIASSITK